MNVTARSLRNGAPGGVSSKTGGFMSEIIVAVVVAVIFFILGIVFRTLFILREEKEKRNGNLAFGIPQYINYAKDIRNNKTDDLLLMIEGKIHGYLIPSMQTTKKGDTHISHLDFDKESPEIIEAWQQAKEYFDTYGLDRIRKDAERWDLTAELFELFEQKLKEVPSNFKEKYAGGNALSAPEPEFDKWNDPPVTLEQLRGKVVLLNFWALGCLPCKQMMPQLKKLKEKYEEKGLEIISIAPPCKDDKQVVDFLSEKDYTFRKEIASSKTWTIYPIRGVQTNFLINKDGYLVQGPIHELPDTDIIEELLVI